MKIKHQLLLLGSLSLLAILAVLGTSTYFARTTDLTKHVPSHGKNEIASIGLAVNTLLDSFKELVADTQQQSSQLKHSSSSMSSELERVVEQFHSQSDHTNSMAAAVQQMVTEV